MKPSDNDDVRITFKRDYDLDGWQRAEAEAATEVNMRESADNRADAAASRRWRPPANHPWRKTYEEAKRLRAAKGATATGGGHKKAGGGS